MFANNMEKSKVVDFFNRCAATWDDEMIRSDARINKILDCAGICEGVNVLDVACGTGVLIPDYLKRKVGKITGVDISVEMIKIAKEKFSLPNVSFIAEDIEMLELNDFDVCVVYNAFPHFENPKRLAKCLSGKLKQGGRLTIAHGMSREEINKIHENCPADISRKLPESKVLKEILDEFFDVDICFEDSEIYMVSGVKREN